jgi:hypothetical protein
MTTGEEQQDDWRRTAKKRHNCQQSITMPATKGDPIRFKRGKYKGQTGWRNDDREDTRHRTYVIVTLLDDTEKETWVKRRSVAAPRGPPTNYFEATLLQHPDIEGLVEQLCFEIARCSLGPQNQNVDPIYESIHDRLNEAMFAQAALGSRATWRMADY